MSLIPPATDINGIHVIHAEPMFAMPGFWYLSLADGRSVVYSDGRPMPDPRAEIQKAVWFSGL